jgi:alpha-beta hydrolase superfamily lysophospholipase
MHSSQILSSAFHLPSLSMLATEPLRALFDHFGAHVASPPQAVGDGHPVVVYPGLGAGAFNTSHLRGYLTSSGFTVRDWEGGVNTGPEGMFDDWLGTLDDRVRELHRTHGRKVSLVGWSLGGLYAREIAKRCPGSVRQVITLGTPFASQARLRACPPVPTTSVYSKSDGIVSWRGCVEKKTPRSESIEVSASHLGMVSHPEVLRIIVDRLAQREGQWRPLKRPT